MVPSSFTLRGTALQNCCNFPRCAARRGRSNRVRGRVRCAATITSLENCGLGGKIKTQSFQKLFSGGHLFVFVEYLCNRRPKIKTKNIKNYSSILAIVNHRNRLDDSPPLKTAEVVPIFKKGERELCSNYRPISILNAFAKLFEKCLLDQLNNYFVSNNLISPNQYGFNKNCSTNEAVLDIYNKYLTMWIKSSLRVLFS